MKLKQKIMRKLTILFISNFFLILSCALGVNVPFDSEKWDLPEGQAEVEEYLGQKSLLLKGGIAFIKGLELANGIVDFDMAVSAERGFSGAIFRMSGKDQYEEFYIRPHQSGNPDALQYTPVFNFMAAWQLYHGPGFGATVTCKVDEWMHVRIIFFEGQGEIYIDDMETPVIFMHELKHTNTTGTVGLKVGANRSPAHYANFSYQELTTPPDWKGSYSPAPTPPGTIKEWMVSQAFSDVWFDNYKFYLPESHGAETSARDWTILPTEPDGLANISRLHRRTPENNTVFAGIDIQSETDRIQPLELAFSDQVRVFVNGKIVFEGQDNYTSRDYRFLGSIGFFDTIYLPLQKGKNEIRIAITETFGGWGVKGRLPESR